MSTRVNKILVLAGLAAVCAIAQTSAPVHGKITLPANSPVSLLSADWGDSGMQARGGAMTLDIRLNLQLRNEDRGRRIRGVTLAVVSPGSSAAVGGKASVTVPTLDVGPGDAFPVRWTLQLLRPLQTGSGPDVEVTLDGVLFDNLSFFGPDQLKSRRTMTVWELESRRDRKYFRALLESNGVEGLRAAIIESAQRQQDRPRVGVSMARNNARVTNTDTEHQVQFAFLKMPEAPVEALNGVAKVSANEAVVPQFEIHNKSDKQVQHLELGLIVRDGRGREFLAGSAPADPSLGPGQRAKVSQDTLLRFPATTVVDGMSGVVTSVEFIDGQMWVPSRAALNADPRLKALMPPSPEEQRLLQLYQKRGIQAVLDELKRAN